MLWIVGYRSQGVGLIREQQAMTILQRLRCRPRILKSFSMKANKCFWAIDHGIGESALIQALEMLSVVGHRAQGVGLIRDQQAMTILQRLRYRPRMLKLFSVKAKKCFWATDLWTAESALIQALEMLSVVCHRHRRVGLLRAQQELPVCQALLYRPLMLDLLSLKSQK
jgi:hypothetical protein